MDSFVFFTSTVGASVALLDVCVAEVLVPDVLVREVELVPVKLVVLVRDVVVTEEEVAVPPPWSSVAVRITVASVARI